MKIELKKISVNLRMSEETTMFIADLYINGKNVGQCKNDGRGGNTDYRGFTKENNELIREAEAYCKTLPKVKYGDMEWEQTLEGVIDDIVYEHIKAKEDMRETKKLLKHMQTAILIGVPNANSYSYFKANRLLSDVPKPMLQKFVTDLQTMHCKDGKIILNTNLKELGINY